MITLIYTLLDNSDPNSGLLIKLNKNGSSCPEDSNMNYSASLRLFCDPSIKEVYFVNLHDFNTNYCNNDLIGYSSAACPKSNFMTINRNFIIDRFFLVVLVLTGIYLVIWGSQYILTTTIIIGILPSLLICSMLFTLFLVNANSSDIIKWTFQLCAYLIGFLLGALFFNYRKFFLTFISIYSGFVMFSLILSIYNQFLLWFYSNKPESNEIISNMSKIIVRKLIILDQSMDVVWIDIAMSLLVYNKYNIQKN